MQADRLREGGHGEWGAGRHDDHARELLTVPVLPHHEKTSGRGDDSGMSQLVYRYGNRNRIFLFNDALNTFYLWLYGIRHMVMDLSDSEKGNPLPFRLTARVLLYTPSHRQDSTYFVTPVVEHWLEPEIAQWVHPMKDRSDDPSHHK